ncbi:hypothetical protein CONPUDRAFT_133640 [Coniophora puteana RWD-64-598 SS2]|uniref:F-box domain-containing protein n=1 Tax=Coniophora puteana (strain RWD-64-598) TaxID=741705 RepID=A0A5M3N3L8_CONPW|nr:uncharacterized protein CONPUDRAFT_133640 [Coniophora puteana RWD-64-598 SS2]EIW85953.1 hypothetical protein CONPUDRAFT_133640 [Coniophora puteana RWD-64-598 SS2]
MHRCFQILEILVHLLCCVDSKEPLSRLARTCKLFKEPALDALYAVVDDFCDLLMCLPRDALIFTPHGSGLDLLGFQRDISTSDWNILMQYTSRVRILRGLWGFDTPFPNPNVLITDEACQALSSCPLPSGTLFPKLRTLRLVEPGDAQLEMMRSILLGTRLIHLFIHSCTFFAGDFSGQVPDLASRAPSLETLVIEFDEKSDLLVDEKPVETTTAMANNICQLQRIRTIQCGPVNERLLEHYASLPELNALTIQVSHDSQWLASQGPPYRMPQSLTIQAIQYETGGRALRRLAGTTPSATPQTAFKLRLRTVKFDAMWPFGSAEPLASFTTALASCACPGHLTEVTISNACDNADSDVIEPDEAYYPVKIDDLQPLTHLSNLRRLSLVYSVIPILGGQHGQLLDLLPSWPLLETLEIRPFSLSATTLIIVLTDLPNLSNLAIDVVIEDAELETIFEKLDFRTLPTNERISALSIHNRTDRNMKSLEPLFHRLVPRVMWSGD